MRKIQIFYILFLVLCSCASTTNSLVKSTAREPAGLSGYIVTSYSIGADGETNRMLFAYPKDIQSRFSISTERNLVISREFAKDENDVDQARERALKRHSFYVSGMAGTENMKVNILGCHVDQLQ